MHPSKDGASVDNNASFSKPLDDVGVTQSGVPCPEKALVERAVNRREHAAHHQRCPPKRVCPSRRVASLPHRIHSTTRPFPISRRLVRIPYPGHRNKTGPIAACLACGPVGVAETAGRLSTGGAGAGSQQPNPAVHEPGLRAGRVGVGASQACAQDTAPQTSPRVVLLPHTQRSAMTARHKYAHCPHEIGAFVHVIMPMFVQYPCHRVRAAPTSLNGTASR